MDTRGNRTLCRLAANSLQRDIYALEVVSREGFGRRSFSLLKVSQKCSQLIHMRFVSSSPAGFRLETTFKIDKKKMNFIFHREQQFS
jgi:hypothetical protein